MRARGGAAKHASAGLKRRDVGYARRPSRRAYCDLARNLIADVRCAPWNVTGAGVDPFVTV